VKGFVSGPDVFRGVEERDLDKLVF